ncbi:MAG: hypothetical protein ABII19_02220 [Patescibacteria group bacterium]
MSERENIPPGAADWKAPKNEPVEKKSEEGSDTARDLRERGWASERQIMAMADQLFKDYEKARALRQGADPADGEGLAVEALVTETGLEDAILKMREVFAQLAKRVEAGKKREGGV